MNSTVRSITNAFRSLFGYPPLMHPHMLTAAWSIDDAEVLSSQHGFDVEDELTTTLAEEIRATIDADVLSALRMMADVMHRINFKYNRGSMFDMNHRHKRSRFNMLNGTRGCGFKPRPTRYLTY